MNIFLVYSPMEQFQSYPIINQSATLTNTTLYLIIAALISIVVSIAHKGEIVATWWGIQNESLYRTIQNMLEEHVGKNYSVYFPQLYTLFNLIQFSNLLGMTPYSTTPTVEIVLTQTLSMTQQIGTLLLGVLTHKLYQFAAFLPAGTPQAQVPLMVFQEVLAYQIKIISLGQRQAINQTTGHVLVKTIIGLVWGAYLEGTSIQYQAQPLVLQTQFQAQEILIAYLQSFIFVFIFCLTLRDMA